MMVPTLPLCRSEGWQAPWRMADLISARHQHSHSVVYVALRYVALRFLLEWQGGHKSKTTREGWSS
jgi:hypothetical protein